MQYILAVSGQSERSYQDLPTNLCSTRTPRQRFTGRSAWYTPPFNIQFGGRRVLDLIFLLMRFMHLKLLRGSLTFTRDMTRPSLVSFISTFISTFLHHPYYPLISMEETLDRAARKDVPLWKWTFFDSFLTFTYVFFLISTWDYLQFLFIF